MTLLVITTTAPRLTSGSREEREETYEVACGVSCLAMPCQAHHPNVSLA